MADLEVRVAPGNVVFFRYKNWRNENHDYVISVEEFALGPYDEGGTHGNPNDLQWVMHGNVVTRDGDARDKMGTRRRTFLLNKIHHLELK